MQRSPLLVLLLSLGACGGSSEPAASPPPPPPAVEPGAQPLTPEECQAQSGEVIYDKGNGTVEAEGCPEGRTQLGTVRGGAEGAICCSLSGSAPTGPATGKRAPCTLGADQTCNEDPKVSALWGKCTEQGVCVCNPGFELSPGGYCRPAL
jgi:hypothetical protein